MSDNELLTLVRARATAEASSGMDLCTIWKKIEPDLEKLEKALEPERPFLAHLLQIVIDGVDILCP